MGLRVNTNVGALTALRNLQRNSRVEERNFERLSTGLRINRGADDPSGLVLLEQFRGDLSAIAQAVDNTQNARNLVDVADSALSQVSNRIVELRSNVIASLNTGVNGPDAQRALQNSIDAGLSAIDRVGATTRFGDRNLLNGTFGFTLTNVSPELEFVEVQGGSFEGGFPQTIGVNVTTAATRGQATGTIAAVQSGASVVNVRGPEGVEQLSFSAGATQQNVIDAINAVSQFTGVEATPAGEIRTIEFGSAASVQIEEVSGDLEGITPGLFAGTDIAAQVNGQAVTGQGSTITVNTNAIAATVQVEDGATGSFSFTVEGGGARFQIGPVAGGANDITIGIGATNSSTLGGTSGLGSLSSLRTGAANNIVDNPAGAIAVLDAAANEVSGLRSRLGSVSGRLFEANLDTLAVAFQNLSASASQLGDANFADEVAQSVRNGLLRQSGLAVLGQANLNAGLALRLLA